MRLLPWGKPGNDPGFPQVFPTTFPQPVEKSVDIPVKMWKKPRISKLFRDFTREKSAFDVVDKFRSVLSCVLSSCGNFLRVFQQKCSSKKQKAEPEAPSNQGDAVQSLPIFYNVQINRSITPYPSPDDRFKARSAAWQAVTALRRRTASVLRACLR